MCETLHLLYSDWESSPDVHAVILKGAGGKAFCAGGDVKGMVQLLLAGQQDRAIRSATPLSPCTTPLARNHKTHIRPLGQLHTFQYAQCTKAQCHRGAIALHEVSMRCTYCVMR